mmetsp:Transcript_5882/g.18853  ORF Transcript_5882/g.18853 Transcript_5882/m.18853 type:complete len:228 (+) Transcript_5882:321-1004(+)
MLAGPGQQRGSTQMRLSRTSPSPSMTCIEFFQTQSGTRRRWPAPEPEAPGHARFGQHAQQDLAGQQSGSRVRWTHPRARVASSKVITTPGWQIPFMHSSNAPHASPRTGQIGETKAWSLRRVSVSASHSEPDSIASSSAHGFASMCHVPLRAAGRSGFFWTSAISSNHSPAVAKFRSSLPGLQSCAQEKHIRSIGPRKSGGHGHVGAAQHVKHRPAPLVGHILFVHW